MKHIILISFLIIFSNCLFAQSDNYTGTWKTENISVSGLGELNMKLQVGISEKFLLYPATLKIEADSFTANYEFLMVKKDGRTLFISKNKYARSEQPSLYPNTTYLFDGSFDHSKDLKGQQTLTFTSIPYKKSALLPDTAKLNDTAKLLILRLSDYLNNNQLVFTKSNNLPWQSPFRDQVLTPSESPVYFGLIDTIVLPQRDGTFSVMSDKKNSVDIVSLGLNGRILFDQVLVSKKRKQEEILLDTGMNILVAYAENFGNSIPNHGKFSFDFGEKKFQLDFTNRADSAAIFIAAKIYCSAEKYNETYFPLYGGNGFEPMGQGEKLISSMATRSKDITLAVWDDAVEDGDSVSIKIDSQWIVRGFPVLKKPQFIPISLKPGRNAIIFSGDNLGSIPPNTSVLEIIDGTKRKAFYIETGVGEKNVLRIFYDH